MTWVDFEETYSLVAIAKSIRIMFAITVWYDYEIWQMDMKMAFLNEFVEEEIYVDQPDGFTSVGEEQKVCHLQRSIMVSNKFPGAGISGLMRSYEVMISSRANLTFVYTTLSYIPHALRG
ncbi:UNVERIFIED_CONTAM: hypothetical protein Sangu_2521500 [Sesamum angustifolium]|uniref:Reverse transcriptase Ty1/copia-type domain-containing protein n=1 Tax=Sesamum angustifolium TaxID=2727405 RepID=A0AAW2JGL3_9LAMI